MPGLLCMAKEEGIEIVDNDGQGCVCSFSMGPKKTQHSGGQIVILMKVALCFCEMQPGIRVELNKFHVCTGIEFTSERVLFPSFVTQIVQEKLHSMAEAEKTTPNISFV